MGTPRRYWIHAQRPKHERLMALAESNVEHARYLVRRGDAKGWFYVQKAVTAVVECGCPASMWRASVREQLGRSEDAG